MLWYTCTTEGSRISGLTATRTSSKGHPLHRPESHYARTRGFRRPPPKYQWMTRGLFLNVGKGYLDKGEVSYDVYQLK